MDLKESYTEMEHIQNIDYTDLFTDSASKEKLDAQFVRDVSVEKKGPQFEFSHNSDEYQIKFIDSDDETIKLLAPAGSGKTQSIINRVLKLCSKGKNPSSFLILTFDNAASISLSEKLETALKDLNLNLDQKPKISTLNAFGYQVLKKYLKNDGENLNVSSPNDHRECFRRAKKIILENPRISKNAHILFPSNIKDKMFIEIMSAFKNYIIDPDNIDKELLLDMFENTSVLKPWNQISNNLFSDENTHSIIAGGLVTLYCNFCKIQKDTRHIDFDDQKLMTYLRLVKRPEAVDIVMANFQEIIVDEFQDINRLDFELIKLISGKRKLIIVGDDDQAIYGFRGCSPKYILKFEESSKRKTQTYILSKNYRCPKNIVEKSMKLIRNNKEREDKEVISHSKLNADIRIWNAVNCGGEAQIVARMIKKIINERNDLKFDQISILFRMNSQSLPLQIALILEDIPYYCRKEDNILLSEVMHKVIKLIELYIKLKKNPGFHSIDHTQNLLKSYFRYANDNEIRSVHSKAEIYSGYMNFTSSLGGINNKFQVSGFRDAINSLFKNHNSAESLMRDIGVNFKNIGGMIGSLEEAYNNFLPLGEFIDISSRFKGSIGAFYDLLNSLVIKVQRGLYHDTEGEAVSLLSYFRAKGRQWDTVFLPGSNQNVIPHQNAKIEEERRLYYVAVTRSTSNLFISYVRKAVGQNVNASQFIFEMGLGEGTEKRATHL